MKTSRSVDSDYINKDSICVSNNLSPSVNQYTVYLQVVPSGLIINPELPWIGASPDGMVTCTCHGDGVLEMKCQFNSKDCSLTESCKDPSFCLVMGEDGAKTLKTDHK